MPLSDVLNSTLNESPVSGEPVKSPKRPLDHADGQTDQLPTKRSRTLDHESHSDQPSATPHHTPAPAPSDLMPAPCDTTIQLRFQLHRFKGVYRVARLPLTFTFAHLYRYILLLFGWSGMHLHEFTVLSNVELYARTNRPGEIKKHRSFRIPPEPDREEDRQAWLDWLLLYAHRVHDPVMRVRPRVKAQDEEWLWGKEPLNMDDPYDRMLWETRVPCRKESETTLADVWNVSYKRNISEGKCGNKKLAIKFEYDLGAPWEVDITIDPNKQGEYIWRGAPCNYPVLVTAKGAPPLEDAVSYKNDIEGKKKKVPDVLFQVDTFERYLKGEICSVVCNTELAVYMADEPPASVLEENDSADEDEDDW